MKTTKVGVEKQGLRLGGLGLLFPTLFLKVLCGRLPVQACLAMQKGMFLDGASTQAVLVLAVLALSIRCWRCHVRDLLGIGMLAADLGDADV
jgi:hypothetical protein